MQVKELTEELTEENRKVKDLTEENRKLRRK